MAVGDQFIFEPEVLERSRPNPGVPVAAHAGQHRAKRLQSVYHDVGASEGETIEEEMDPSEQLLGIGIGVRGAREASGAVPCTPRGGAGRLDLAPPRAPRAPLFFGGVLSTNADALRGACRRGATVC